MFDATSNGGPTRAARARSVAIVGGGFGGVGMATLLRRAGYRHVVVFERGERVGGVWHHNTYPGAACDVPSHLYEFAFAPNPGWSRRYAPQAEIQAYLEDVARRHGVLEQVRTGVEVTRAEWSEERASWRLQTTAGEHEADLLVTACGQLSVPKRPPLKGLETFAGEVFHTAEWRHDVDLAGRRVSIVGTGCSAIQTAPVIAAEVAALDIYQRSPGWTFPKMDFAYSERSKQLFERYPLLQRLDRWAVFAFMELGAAGMTGKPWLMAPFRALARIQISRSIKDPELRGKVTPGDEVGCKRLMLTDEWYPTLTRQNVELVVDPIAEITPSGVRTADGVERTTDVIILATGFRSHDFVAPMEIVGCDGRTLAEEWAELPRAYLGLSVPGFPNMFLVYGPNTNGGTGSVIYTIEAAAAHVIAALGELRRAGAGAIEVRQRPRSASTASSARRWRARSGTPGARAGTWTRTGTIPSQWPWLWSSYRRRAERIAPGDYELHPPARYSSGVV